MKPSFTVLTCVKSYGSNYYATHQTSLRIKDVVETAPLTRVIFSKLLASACDSVRAISFFVVVGFSENKIPRHQFSAKSI